MQAEESRRNSTLADMLFVSCSHALAPYIFSFYDRFGHLTGKARSEAKEEINPLARSVPVVYIMVQLLREGHRNIENFSTVQVNTCQTFYEVSI